MAFTKQIYESSGQGLSASEAIIEAVAASAGVDPLSLSQPLYDVVDPDALDALFAPTAGTRRGGGSLRIAYCGYDVEVRSDGRVTVNPLG